MEDGGGMVNRYAAEHIIINGKDNIEPWINRYFVPEEEYQQLEAENAQLNAELCDEKSLHVATQLNLKAQTDSVIACAKKVSQLKASLAQATQREARLRETFKGLKVTNEQLVWGLREIGPTGSNADAYIKAAVEHFMVMRKQGLEEAGT